MMELERPRERSTFLFSATMTSKVAKLQRASLRNPTHVKVDEKFQTPKNLTQVCIQQFDVFVTSHVSLGC